VVGVFPFGTAGVRAMIVVKIELHSAITGRVSEIGRMLICNDGAGSADRGDYSVQVLRRKDRPGGISEYVTGIAAGSEPVTRTAEVKNYPRQSYNVWRLVLRALRGAFPEETGR